MDTSRPSSLVLLVPHQPKVLPQLLLASLLIPSTGDPMDCKAWAAEMGTVCGLQTFKDTKVLFTPIVPYPGASGPSVPAGPFLKAHETC